MEHHCGIISIIGENVYTDIIPSLALLQHRGYEGTGISFNTNNGMYVHKNVGLVENVFNNYKVPKNINNMIASFMSKWIRNVTSPYYLHHHSSAISVILWLELLKYRGHKNET